MKKQIIGLISNRRVILLLYIIFVLVASYQSYIGKTSFYDGGKEYTAYNNYIIFEKSFGHLINHQDLYAYYPDEHWDLYKYTPTFSMFFGIFSIFPDLIGLSLWNLLNALILLFGVYYLPKFSELQKGLILLLISIELVTSLQNEQSNGLIAGLLIFSFVLLEKDKPFWATLLIVLSAYVKLFGVVGFALFLFYPHKMKAVGYSLFWTIILGLIPLLVIDLNHNIMLYNSYLSMLVNDHSISVGYSVMSWMETWFNLKINKNLVVLAGVLLFLLPFYRFKMYKEFNFKLLALSSILLWIVLFNHKAESPSFILAMTGVAIWFMQSEKNILNISLFVLAFIFTSLSPTDVFPRWFREEIAKPYVLKVIPCMLIWLKILYDLMVMKISGESKAVLENS